YQDPNTGLTTVTNEISCNVVEPHRARSNAFLLNNSTAPAAGLTAFPTLTLSTGRSVATDQSDEGRDQPKLLPARYGTDPNEPDTLEVGPLTYTIDTAAVDPATATTSSLLLSYQEPRAYVPNEAFSVTYEGVVRAASESVFSVDEATGFGVMSGGVNASFCSSGIQDVDAAAEVGRNMHVSNSQDLTRFSRDHADYVQITSDLLDEDDPYWQPGSAGSQCGDELYESAGNPAAQRGRDLCELFFGTADNPATTRDLRIVAASEDHLTVEPRSWDPSSASEQRRLQLLHFTNCCFHGPPTYQVRGGSQWIVRGSASGFSHHIIADPSSGRCVNDCNPLTQRLVGRAFEISCSDKCPLNADGRPVVGAARPGEDFVCVVDDTTGGIDPGKPGSECIFQSLTTRFAIYRGQPPAQQPGMSQQSGVPQQSGTQRDTTFRWQLSGGFSPLTISLTTSTDRPLSAPQTLVPLPELGQLMVTDAASPGLVFIGVNTTTLTTNSVF
ncbi:MAG TPA: hypothetical protein VG963_07540, partial [Polyangiaceae bacterium]|nr:hypothetical protein [Polyangiaceae bacterium]